MKIDVLTLFPSMFDGFLNESIIKRGNKRCQWCEGTNLVPEAFTGSY